MGQGYVGLPLAMAAVEAGHHVTGFEPDQERLEQLCAGTSYIEDVPGRTLSAALKSGRYRPTHDDTLLTDFDIAVITVPAPLKERQPDLGAVREAAETLARHVRKGDTVILESTTHPGTTRKIVLPILEALSRLRAGTSFHLGFSPERIDPGNEQWSFANTPKIVSGLTEECRNRVAEFYAGITQHVVLANSLEEAELAKVFENVFRHVNVALVNELCRVAHTLDVDVWQTLALADSRPFGFTRFSPGHGVDGHCLPVDPVFLTRHVRTQYGEPFRLVELAQDINETQPSYVVGRVQDALDTRYGKALEDARVLALGLACKPGAADACRSPAVEVVAELRRKGAIVDALDPHVAAATQHPPQPYGTYDAVVLLTEHDEFDLAAIASEAVYVLDTRGVMPAAPHIERL
ncbi:nucleotide sugar dehydrogenase [Streptomyces sp. S.PB5]|uniref:nucleotide sugar dehydrogenase n=1 Tax=Streptomyces sp. S.PB5 TaxID=3020844 RepID=UPI0025B12197|nr:nucleotide sugar dehydrogenase [Streptomyces sp. S.PB5]MDN3026046.1 nucleotide sugar dehydrogenase [Streptomyces sp. S.PB5]